MTNARNKNILWFGLAGVLALGALFFSAVQLTHAQPSSVSTESLATATTSVNYMTAGAATTTYQFDSTLFSSGKIANMQQIDSSSIYLQFTASSTVSAVAYQFQYSNNGVDWYGEGSNVGYGTTMGSTTNNAVQIATSSVTHIWAPGAAGTSTVPVLRGPDIPSQHERLVVSIPPGSAAGAVYLEVDLKKNPSNP